MPVTSLETVARCYVWSLARTPNKVTCAPKISALGATAWAVDVLKEVEKAQINMNANVGEKCLS